MTDLRTAAQQALAFTMRDFASLRDFEAAKAVLHDNLRTALAQQDEPAQKQDAELSAALGWPGGISNPVLDRKVLLQKVAALRLASQQALEAWDGDEIEWFKRGFTVMENLRAALAQQDEPVAGCETEADCTSQPWCRIRGECQRKQAEPVRSPSTPQEKEMTDPNSVCFSLNTGAFPVEMLRLDGSGFHYKGKVIEDAGEAYNLFKQWLVMAQQPSQEAEPVAGKVVAWGVFAKIDGEWQLQHPVFAGDEQGKVNAEFERASYSGPQPLEVRPLGVVTATAQQAEPAQDQRCRAEPRSDGDFVCDCKIGECPGRSAALAQQAEPAQDRHGACPTHCCPVHGCKYMHDDCPVVSGAVQPVYPRNNGCESCADEAEPLNLSDRAVQRRLAAQWGYVPAAQAEPVEPVATLIAQRDALLEALKPMIDLAEFWINHRQKRHMSEQEYKVWIALGHKSNAMLKARAAIKAVEGEKK